MKGQQIDRSTCLMTGNEIYYCVFLLFEYSGKNQNTEEKKNLLRNKINIISRKKMQMDAKEKTEKKLIRIHQRL